jgi:type IV pilus assembly protein PilC
MNELEIYYEQQIKLRQEFWSEISWPLVQFVIAILLITGLIYLFGILQPLNSAQPLDPLGLGLYGGRGALIFFGTVVGTLVGGMLLLTLFRVLFRGRLLVEWTLMRLPVLGPCLYSLALLRYSVALKLMLQTNLSIMKTLRLALRATDNPVFTHATTAVEAALKRGNSVSASMAAARIFPAKFLSVVAIAEECGRLPETLQLQARELDENTRRRLARLNRFATWGIWLGISSLIIFAIFRIFFAIYVKQIEKQILVELSSWWLA